MATVLLFHDEAQILAGVELDGRGEFKHRDVGSSFLRMNAPSGLGISVDGMGDGPRFLLEVGGGIAKGNRPRNLGGVHDRKCRRTGLAAGGNAG